MSADEEKLKLMRHDIKNQLSNIQLALNSLKYEVANPSDDVTFCIDTIAQSAKKIDELLGQID